MSDARLSNQHARAEPTYMWAISVRSGRQGVRWLDTSSIRRTRSEAIRAYAGNQWPKMRAYGDRCVRVLVTETV